MTGTIYRRSRFPTADLCAALLIILIVSFIWGRVYHRWTVKDWRVPISYEGDTWWGLAYNKALTDGAFLPILPKTVHALGAPFEADWNDYPTVDEGLSILLAIPARLAGIYAGQNLSLLFAHLLSALTFFYVCRKLRYERALSAAAAILFCFSPYAFWRGAAHLGLTYYWHLPLGILVVWQCLARAPFDRRKWVFAIVVAIAFATQNIYYTGLFLQFLVWAALICLLQNRSWKRVLTPLGLCMIIFATFALMNVDTFYSNHVNGPNPTAVARIYSGVENYALKPIELVMPGAHRWHSFGAWAWRAYFSQALFVGEGGAVYLGFVGIAALLFLTWTTTTAVARRHARNLPSHFWFILWIILYSVVGGVNGFIGVFGMVLFRCSNRYSIAILAFLLFFLVRELSRISRRGQVPGWAFAMLLLVVGLADQLPAQFGSSRGVQTIRRKIKADRGLAKTIEAKLPVDAMLFQLPVMEFPETPPLGNLHDYEHFRLYLNSSHLRFSYGDEKGRTREQWQREAEQLGPIGMVPLLEKYGFGAVVIAKKGYADGGAGLTAEFKTVGRSDILAESDDFVSIALHPTERPVLPPNFIIGWFGLEGNRTANWRWSNGDASVVLYNNTDTERSVHLRFSLKTILTRQVEVSLRNEKLTSFELRADEPPGLIDQTIMLFPGKNYLHFHTDIAGAPPNTDDKRTLAFALHDFSVD